MKRKQKAKRNKVKIKTEDWDEYVKECWNDSTAILDISWCNRNFTSYS